MVKALLFLILSVIIFIEKAFDEEGNLKQPKQLSINKVGHGMPGIPFCLISRFLREMG